ncbi:MAG: hypothetical protein IJ846_01865 [Alphaproteobacteria bacterium]|nr:hypothetical protein [Alphaproteobacteria bacterium]
MSLKPLRFSVLAVGALLAQACSSGPSYRYDSQTQNYAPSNQQSQYNQPQAYSETPYIQRAPGDSHPLLPQGKKIRLKAEDIKFISSYNLPTRAPNVDQLMLVYPEQIIHKWATNRFGVDKTPDRHVRFLIIDASIVEERIYTGGSLNKSAKHKYIGRFEISLQITDSEGRVLSETRKSADSRDLPESETVIDQEASFEAREKLWMGMTYDLLKRLSVQLEQELSTQSFNEFIDR